ncbi:MAG TPA: ferredoxin--NADP reductase [Steroidobacteraceae bacterium]|nr:ferredoxin--NADP reductase [Steroidobacteraceae bacterium]
MATYTTEHVTEVTHWSPKLFSFHTTRSPTLRFENGQFLMIGLEVAGRRVARAYSIASANYEEELEFYSIIVPGGPLTSRLCAVQPGAPILISGKPTGTLVLRDLRPGRRLFLLATGTGVAPFAALIKDPETYERFERIVLVRGGRTRQDLAYGDAALRRLREDPYLGEPARRQLSDYAALTREPFARVGRITELLAGNRVCGELGLPPLDPAADRVMICGNMGMLADARALLDARGFSASPAIGCLGDYVFERAFVDAVESHAAPLRQASGA